MSYTTITISKLIETLTNIKEEEGDLLVVIASDKDGSELGIIKSNEPDTAIEGNMLCIYPYASIIDPEDIAEYKDLKFKEDIENDCMG